MILTVIMIIVMKSIFQAFSTDNAYIPISKLT